MTDLPRPFPTIAHLFAEAVARSPGVEALACDGRRLTYAQYGAAVSALARELEALGVRHRRVAVLLGNGFDICIASFAVHCAGAQLVPLNPLYTASELGPILEDADPCAIIHGTSIDDIVAPIAARLGVPRLCIGPGGRDLADQAALSAAFDLPPFPAPEDPATLQYTGGTTGRAKGVDLRHGALAVNISQREAVLPTRIEGERILCIAPLYHSYASAMCLHLAAHARSTLVILPRYKAEDCLRLLAAERITHFAGNPTVYTGLLAHPDFGGTDLSALTLCYSGSAALPEEILRRWEALTGVPICEGYGQTEAGPILTYNPANGLRKPGSVGPAVMLTKVQVVDAETGTRVLPPGEAGEIRARAPQIMSGYRNRPEETARALRDGWLYTGDVGEFDADGYLYIRDRLKDMVITGGFNVYPREVEEVLHRHEAVLEAAVIGLKDPYKGEKLRAYVVARAGASLQPETLRAFCRTHLTGYKVPSEFVLVDRLPRTTVGKVDKVALRSLAMAG